MKKKIKLELLSPARNLEIGIEAVNSGADAVYIGVNHFGARSAAGNSIEDIKELVDYAHLFNVQIFVTLNTILYEHELIQVQELIHELYKIGVDAIIIQDLGILKMDLPPIAIHASTQANNYHLDQIKLMESLGVSRVVLARELSLAQIHEISQHTTVELECFVHGALCVSLSGQCYMSQYTHKRSANRGECAQLCRLPYNLVDGKGRTIIHNQHLLSLKDMNRVEYLAELAEAGVMSFKIEGRLKDISYVKNITTEYHRRLDKICMGNTPYERASCGKISNTVDSDPYKTFNRGFTNYFLIPQNDRGITSFDTPKSRGEWIGKVEKVVGNKLYIKTNITIHNGDGLCFFDQKKELQGIRVNRVEGACLFLPKPQNIPIGIDLYRNKDHQFSTQLERASEPRIIELSATVRFLDKQLIVELIDCMKNKFKKSFLVSEELPNNQADFKKKFKTQFTKTGGTIYAFNELNVDTDLPFLPMGQVNEMRRIVLKEFNDLRLYNYLQNRLAYPEKSIPEQVKGVLSGKKINYKYNVSNSLAKQIYYELGGESIDVAFELEYPKHEIGKYALMTTKHCIRFELGDCPKMKSKKKPICYPLFLTNKNARYRLEFDCRSCEMSLYVD